MKRTILFMIGAVLLFTLLFFASSPASAIGLGALCTVDPAAAPAGALFTITCSGFVPGEQTNAWLTEPDGATIEYNFLNAGNFATGKVDSKGNVTYRYSSGIKDYKVGLGPWALTVKGKNAIGIGRFRVQGGTEGVSGASLKYVNGVLIGSGFGANEIVTLWIDFPNGDCSANWFDGPGLSTATFANLKADANGSFSFPIVLDPDAFDCAGFYHFVARGNTSHLGGDTYIATRNHHVTENATLIANPDRVFAIGQLITFNGSGFEPFETVTCWDTTPQGATPPVGNENVDANGNFTTGFHTGSFIAKFAVSNGALGKWFLTCRGNKSGRIGIASYLVVGGIIDP